MGTPSFQAAIKSLGDTGIDHLAAMVENAPFGVYIDHPTKGCIYANPTLLRQFDLDWETFQGYGWARFVVPEDSERIQNVISAYVHKPESLNITYRVRSKKDAPIRWINADARAVLDKDGNHLGSICSTRDVTEETELAAHQTEEQKMEAVGQLAARLAHDLNNLLTAIIGNTELIGLEVKSEKGRARLENIEVVFDQARNLTSQLLTLSRKDVHQPSASQLDLELERLERLLQSTVGNGIELVMCLEARKSHVALNFSQLGQIMLNLCSNARDAMNGKGQVHITSSRDKDSLKLTIQDSGIGMESHTLEQAFKPFFTTKEQGRGSGLGLATVRNLVELVNGSVALESSKDNGTTVTIILPVVEPLVSAAKRNKSGPPASRNGTILIIEDNDSVRQSLAFSLALVGYEVSSTSSIAEARRWLLEADQLTGVVSDVLLPDGLGTVLLEEIRNRWPNLPVVFNSGFAGDASAKLSSLEDTNTAFVPKPFRTREILEALDSLTY